MVFLIVFIHKEVAQGAWIPVPALFLVREDCVQGWGIQQSEAPRFQ